MTEQTPGMTEQTPGMIEQTPGMTEQAPGMTEQAPGMTEQAPGWRESDRIQALLDLNLLDTRPQERFDRLTRLARRLFDVPISLVTIVDEAFEPIDYDREADLVREAMHVEPAGYLLKPVTMKDLHPEPYKDLRYIFRKRGPAHHRKAKPAAEMQKTSVHTAA